MPRKLSLLTDWLLHGVHMAAAFQCKTIPDYQPTTCPAKSFPWLPKMHLPEWAYSGHHMAFLLILRGQLLAPQMVSKWWVLFSFLHFLFVLGEGLEVSYVSQEGLELLDSNKLPASECPIWRPQTHLPIPVDSSVPSLTKFLPCLSITAHTIMGNTFPFLPLLSLNLKSHFPVQKHLC